MHGKEAHKQQAIFNNECVNECDCSHDFFCWVLVRGVARGGVWV